ncbi:glycosyltransferase [Mycobacteroides sp. LB1]|uniref:glycosyltransferase n=1 Tax=Mycobacteroides sp. LB1 TaxID=2750814 RepID=UPI0015E0161E|nr:glycosyltransferase [Mycobacteroides sp. LB1]
MNGTGPRIAIVHERFTEFGGSELVVAEFMKTWPDAKVFAPITEPQCRQQVMQAAGRTDGASHGSISGTWLDGAYAFTGRRSHAPLLPLVPGTLRKLSLGDDVDAVLISHHSFATSAAFATEAPIVAYVHSPARWAWDRTFRDHEIASRSGRMALSALGKLARRGELRAAPRLSHVIANSHAVADRIRDWWGLPSTVISPPVRIDRFSPDRSIPREDFYLCAGRLVPYKRADLAIRAAQRANCRLVVLGDGRFRDRLEAIAGPETTFLGAASDEVLLDTYRRCRALLMPGLEDFGIVPVEAMACGTPVLALGEGGALDTVTPGVTGEHVQAGPDDVVVEQLAALMRDFNPADYDTDAIRARACEFSPEAFRTRIADTVLAAARA